MQNVPIFIALEKEAQRRIDQGETQIELQCDECLLDYLVKCTMYLHNLRTDITVYGTCLKESDQDFSILSQAE